MKLTFDLEGQVYILFLMVYYVCIHTKAMTRSDLTLFNCICTMPLTFTLQVKVTYCSLRIIVTVDVRNNCLGQTVSKIPSVTCMITFTY